MVKKKEYIKVFVQSETKKAFNDFFEANKSLFGTKANMFRVMIANLPRLLTHENFIVDPEKEKLQKELQKANLKIEQLEKLNSTNSKELTDKLNKIEVMITEIYSSDLVNLNKTKTEKFNFKF
ncbi:hypothetical protein [Ligilactobacillus sp. Marseille-Q7487]|uniref:hypothetical protein n=1 Tax=Ligilactobacillus sp. Marseille-Q7487 TaxID=3022128 RepID=UPI0024A8D5B0|nr:hypothetical protein [Ligilactobacillus sp. Marseille-Q7487]